LKQLAQLPITERSQVADARRVAVQMAKSVRFPDLDSSNIAIVATELANNLVNHARNGELIISADQPAGKPGFLDLVSIDRGPGMNIQLALQDGYSTAGTSGTGLGAVQRLSKRFDCYSNSAGTIILAGFGEAIRDVGTIRAPNRGESVCGDSWSVVDRKDSRWIMVCDGLGHGQFAAEASQLAVEIFESSRLDTVAGVMEEIHSGLRSTRGAAVAVAKMTTGRIEFCGLGNIGAVLQSGSASTQMVSLSGTAGLSARKFSQFTYSFPQGGVLILYSDGLQTQWGLERYPGILRNEPTILAGALYRDYSRGRDDVTVLVARQ
jgi:anti-sigma regulatory factor (Ser/Thr protein kinase)